MVEQPAMMELVRLPNTVMDIIFQKKVQLLTILSGLQPRADNQPPSENKLAIQYAQVDASLLGEYELSVDYKNSNNIKISLQTDNNSYIDSLLDIRYPSNGNRAWYNSI